MPKSQDELDRHIRATLAAREAEDRRRVAAARAAGDREPFDPAKFLAVYNVTLDLGNLPLAQEHLDDYERRYYLRSPPEVRTLAAFADHLWWLRQNDAG